MAQTFRIFAERDFDELRGSLLTRLKGRIYSENPNYLLNVNRTEYIEHLVSELIVSPLVLDFDLMTISSSEKPIPAEHFEPNWAPRSFAPISASARNRGRTMRSTSTHGCAS